MKNSHLISFTIPLNPVTKKNHGQIIRVNGKPMIIPSKQYLAYEKDCAFFLSRIEMITEPVNVKALYYMQTKRRVDLCNLHEALCDVLVKHHIIADDNSSIVAAMDGSRVLYDKENPRTEIEITIFNE